MILGLGIDLCDIRRVEKLFARHGARFTQKYFTPAEYDYAMAQPHPVAALAKRWAAKEAAAKALGTGFRDGLFMRDIEIVNGKSGKPSLKFHGRAAQLKPSNSEFHLALTDEYPYALAQVIISAHPKEF